MAYLGQMVKFKKTLTEESKHYYTVDSVGFRGIISIDKNNDIFIEETDNKIDVETEKLLYFFINKYLISQNFPNTASHITG